MFRILDLILSSVGFFILSPIMLLIILVGFLDTGRPIFRQERLGQNKTPFNVIKFRTMIPTTPSLATHLANLNAITPLGGLLRRTKLDELPQLWNVLKGDMSLVGPRPGLPNQTNLTSARNQLGVFDVKPGITGLAQVSGIDMSTPELLARVDAKMISSMSVKNYFKYIILTILGRGQGDKVKPKL